MLGPPDVQGSIGMLPERHSATVDVLACTHGEAGFRALPLVHVQDHATGFPLFFLLERVETTYTTWMGGA